MTLSAIAAMDEKGTIGKNGQLPWNLPEDMRFFRNKTMGHIMLMGRKTFESFPKPLPGRLHVVLTRQPNDGKHPNSHFFSSLDTALKFCQSQTHQWKDEVFVIGGGEIFKQTLPILDKIYLTEIHATFDGDAFFPNFDRSEFLEVERKESGEPPLLFDFVLYRRRR